MSVERDISAGGLPDHTTRSKFGFDSDDETWLDRCRRSGRGPGPAHLGAYELLADAGRGSQGSVYKALQPGTGRVVAIKRLGAGRLATARMRARFDLEILALAALSHPGIVTVFGADEVEGQRILLMEWIDGAPIDAWAGARDVRERLRVFALVCDAVSHAHVRGVIHRDLKPSNILVDRSDAPHVVDFGLARLLDAEGGPDASQTEAFVGTLAYASPEQVAGRSADIDTRTDVYALGAVLYELMTGSLPLEKRADWAGMIDAIRSEQPRRPSSLRHELGLEIDAIVLRALAKEPQQRYQSVAELGLDVRRYLAGEAVLAHPPSRAYRARKFIRRNRAGAMACAAVLLALIGGAAATAVQAVRAVRAEAQSVRERDAARLEARRADAVRDFLTAMLYDARPHVGASSAMTVREAVDRAAAKLDAGSLEDQPEVEEAVRWTLGWVYLRIKARSAASAQFEWVVKYREATLDPMSPKLADALYCWGSELDVIGRTEEADAVLRRSIKIYEVSGPGEWRTLHPLMILAESTRRHGNAQAAIPQYRELIDEFERGGPAYRDERAWAIYGLALCYRDLGQTQECIATFEMDRPLVDQFFQIVSTHRIWFFIDYCLNVTEPAKRHEDTISILKPLLDAVTEPLGVEDADVGRMMAILGTALIETGQGAEAESVLRRLVEVRERTRPHDDPLVHTARSLLGSALGVMGRTDEAESLLVSAVEALASIQTAAPIQRTRALQRLIRHYESVGREDEAAAYRARLDASGGQR